MGTFRRRLQSTSSAPGRTAPSLWLSFERVRHRIIVRTVAGGAAYVARKIDTAKPHDALGTIAGDDTIFVTPTRATPISILIERIQDLFERSLS